MKYVYEFKSNLQNSLKEIPEISDEDLQIRELLNECSSLQGVKNPQKYSFRIYRKAYEIILNSLKNGELKNKMLSSMIAFEYFKENAEFIPFLDDEDDIYV